MWLTNGVDEFEVYIKSDQRNWKQSEIELQHTSNCVDVIVSFYGNVRLVTICQKITPLLNCDSQCCLFSAVNHRFIPKASKNDLFQSAVDNSGLAYQASLINLHSNITALYTFSTYILNYILTITSSRWRRHNFLLTEWWGAGIVIFLWRVVAYGPADPIATHYLLLLEIQTGLGFTFLVPAQLGSPR